MCISLTCNATYVSNIRRMVKQKRLYNFSGLFCHSANVAYDSSMYHSIGTCTSTLHDTTKFMKTMHYWNKYV